ncbi:MAG: SUMF1/EgtB/PvdO family nonheme iron enzyme [Balneolales bacterium]|nr:SUMF1/EgtB/PvdO family nonheme iron enzyme [Balneolales bacterium]
MNIVYRLSRLVFLSACILFADKADLFSQNMSSDQTQSEVRRGVFGNFFDDVSLDIYTGFGNYNGNFSEQGFDLPLPPRGFKFAANFSKSIYSLPEYSLDLRGRWGIEWLNYSSETWNRNRLRGFAQNTRGGFVQANVVNNAIGTSLGLGVNVNLFRSAYIEPSLDFGYYYHNPRTDAFVNDEGELLNRQPGASDRGQSSYNNFRLRQNSGVLAEGETIPAFLPSLNLGFKIGGQIIGYDFFLRYDYHNFLEPWFDGMSDQVGRSGVSNAYSSATFGVSLPLSQRGPRMSREQQIRELATIVQTEEDATEIMNASGGRLLAANARGVRFNELSQRVVFHQVPLDPDSVIVTEMAELPGSNFIIGLSDVDELSIQVAGKKRISINPFKMDRTEVTNLQYRAFLMSMGVDLAAEENITVDRDPLSDEFNIQQKYTWEELLARADLAEFPENYVNPPVLDNVNYLLPDKDSWIRDGMHDIIPYERYFFGTEYLDYPVVGVNWYQAKLFAAWADKRLPTETEWEYAAKSGVSGRVYPWDGHQIQRRDGTYRANYRQSRGVFDLDGFVLMAPVEAFAANDFGLYQMAGNVAEWVLDSYNPSYNVLDSFGSLSFVSPFYVNPRETRKVHRGGSWNSSEFFIGSGVRNFQDKHRASPTVGFRLAQSVEQTIR